MPRICTVCASKRRAEIDRALVAGEGSMRDIARSCRVSKDALLRHKAEHLPAALVRGHEIAETRRGAGLLGQLSEGQDRSSRLYDAAEEILRRALEGNDQKLALNAIGRAVGVMAEARALAELQGQVTGELRPKEPAVSISRVAICMPTLQELARRKGAEFLDGGEDSWRDPRLLSVPPDEPK
jgi:hypothetical protein